MYTDLTRIYCHRFIYIIVTCEEKYNLEKERKNKTPSRRAKHWHIRMAPRVASCRAPATCRPANSKTKCISLNTSTLFRTNFDSQTFSINFFCSPKLLAKHASLPLQISKTKTHPIQIYQPQSPCHSQHDRYSASLCSIHDNMSRLFTHTTPDRERTQTPDDRGHGVAVAKSKCKN